MESVQKKVILLCFIFIFVSFLVTAKTTDEKIDDLKVKTDKMEKYLERLIGINDKASITVHGTEYDYGTDSIAKAWLHLLNSSDGEAIIDGLCYVDIYSPEGEEYIENALMTNMQHDGIYYYDSPVPIGQGVYPVIAKCYYEATSTQVHASSYLVYEGEDRDGGNVDRTWFDDGADVEIETDNNIRATNQLDANYTFENFWGNCSGIDENLLSSISVSWKGKWDTGDINHDINVYFWNHSSNQWVTLSNEIGGGNGGTIFSVSNSLETNNISKALGLSATNDLIVRYNDTLNSEGAKKFRTYYTYASCEQLANPEWQTVRGSSEWHVTSKNPWVIEVTSGTIDNATFPDFFYYNFTIESGVGADTDDVEVYVDMPKPFSCHHINSVSVEGVEYNFTMSNADDESLNKGCKVIWDMDLDVGVNYKAQVVADNWFKEIETLWLTEMQLEHAGVSLVCENYRLSLGFPEYTLPRPNSSNPFAPSNQIDELYDVCYAYLDVYYHYNQSYFNEYYTPQGTFSHDDMLFLDNMYNHMVEGRDELDLIATAIFSTVNAIGSYSTTIIQDPNNLTETNWSLAYASISSTYLNYLLVDALNRSTIDSYPAHQYLGGTEYFVDDSGRISIRLVQSQGGEATPETGATCNITILYPNSTILVTDTMTEYGQGVYTYDFNAPSLLGVYTYYSDCAIDNRSYYGLNTFHIWDIDESKISDEVWSASQRNLTHYETTNLTLSNDSIQEVGDAVWSYEGNITTNILYQFADKVQCYLQNLIGGDDSWNINIRSC